jgi:hypothetical protein
VNFTYAVILAGEIPRNATNHMAAIDLRLNYASIVT